MRGHIEQGDIIRNIYRARHAVRITKSRPNTSCPLKFAHRPEPPVPCRVVTGNGVTIAVHRPSHAVFNADHDHLRIVHDDDLRLP